MFPEVTEDEIIYSSYQLDIVGIFRWFNDTFINYDGDFDTLLGTLSIWWYVFSIFSFIVSVLLLVGIVYATIRYSQLSDIEKERLKEAEHAYRHAHGMRDDNARWQRIIGHVSSENPSEWRLSIIEADIMLGEMLDGLGYTGSSIGEQLKQAQPQSFKSVQDAWDAHKVRNDIAHRGSDFVLTKKIAQETIAKYERVFLEFKFL